MQQPNVSWILCAHKFNDGLLSAINSCLNQTYNNFELIIVCNGPCSDEIETTLSRYYCADPRVRIISTKIYHLTFSLNLALHYAKGKYIARMDSDDIANPTRLEEQINYLNENPHITVLGTDYDIIDLNNNVVKTVRLPKNNYEIKRALVYKNVIAHPSVVFKKNKIIEHGGYSGGQYAQDYDLWTRLSCDPTVVFENLPLIGIGYRSSPIGNARCSRLSYAFVASSQLRVALVHKKLKWFISCAISIIKVIALGK